MNDMKRIVFLCHGNICRSVAAEYIAKDYLAKHGKAEDYEIISRALSHEEIGNDIYPPMKAALRRAGISFGVHHAAFMSQGEFASADEIYYMDESNAIRLRRMFGSLDHRCHQLSDYLEGVNEIDDPWYTGRFDEVVDQLRRCMEHIF